MKNYLIAILVILGAATIAFWGNKVSEIEINSALYTIILIFVYFFVANRILKLDPFELYVGFLILLNVVIFILERFF